MASSLAAINRVLHDMCDYFHRQFGTVTSHFVFVYDTANLFYNSKCENKTTLSSLMACEIAQTEKGLLKQYAVPTANILHIFVNSRLGWGNDSLKAATAAAAAYPEEKENVMPPPPGHRKTVKAVKAVKAATATGTKNRWVQAVATLKTKTTKTALEAAIPAFDVTPSSANVFIVQNYCEFPPSAAAAATTKGGKPTKGRCGFKLTPGSTAFAEGALYDKFHEVDDYLVNLLFLLFLQNGNEVKIRSKDNYRSATVQFVADGQQGFKLEGRPDGAGLKQIYAAAKKALAAKDVYYSASTSLSTVTRKNRSSRSKKADTLSAEAYFSPLEHALAAHGGHTQKSWWLRRGRRGRRGRRER